MKKVEFTIGNLILPSFLIITALFFTTCILSNNKVDTSSNNKVDGCDPIPTFKEDLKRDTKLNLNIFIDLSYRIANKTDHGENIVKDDLAVIEQLAKTWKKHICRKPIKVYNDEFNIRVDPVPEGLNDYFDSLRFDLKELKRRKNEEDEEELKVFLSNFEDTVKSRVKKIYEGVYEKGFDSEKDWIGSDIYGFLDNENQIDKCIQENADNVLIVLTDGYISSAKKNDGLLEKEFNNLIEKKFQKQGIFYNKDLNSIREEGYKFETISTNLENLEVIFSGIDPHVNKNDYKKLEYFLSKWMENMKVENYEIFKRKDDRESSREDIENYFYKSTN